MLWLILLVLGISGVVFTFDSSSGRYALGIVCVWITIISGVFNVALGVDGVSAYQRLMGLKAGVLSLQGEIKRVENAYYPSQGQGSVISGSVENMQQSTALSNYIAQYAEEKAKYNRMLAQALTRKISRIYFWFGDSMYLDKEILKLDFVK